MRCASPDGAQRRWPSSRCCWVRVRPDATLNALITSKNHWRYAMPNFVRQWMLREAGLRLLDACATANADHAASSQPVKDYSREFQKELADEIDSASVDGGCPLAIQDYALLGAQARVGCP